jgi:hypothetical protein
VVPETRRTTVHAAGFAAEPHFSSFPLIVDFEPKKREVYETVTTTGETMVMSNGGQRSVTWH